jgi:hypothetical protein
VWPATTKVEPFSSGGRQRLAEFLNGGQGRLGNPSGIIFELNIEIDFGFGGSEFRDLLTFAERERAGFPVAYAVDEAVLPGLDRRIGGPVGREAAGQRFRLQGVDDPIRGDIIVGSRCQAGRHREGGSERYRGDTGNPGKAGHGFDPRHFPVIGCSNGGKGSIEMI